MLFWPILGLLCAVGTLYCPSRKHAGVSATGKLRPNIKFAAFGCVFLTKIKVDPESW